MVHTHLSDLLREILLPVSTPNRVDAMVSTLEAPRDWPGAERIRVAFEAAGFEVSPSETDRLLLADRVIEWTRDTRRAKATTELASHWQLTLGDLPREVLEVALLDAAGRLTPDGVTRVHEGTRSRVMLDPRRIMELALQKGAVAIVLAHNHPSGVTRPTPQDLNATRQVVLAGATLDVSVLDHLIVSGEASFSFREKGLL